VSSSFPKFNQLKILWSRIYFFPKLHEKPIVTFLNILLADKHGSKHYPFQTVSQVVSVYASVINFSDFCNLLSIYFVVLLCDSRFIRLLQVLHVILNKCFEMLSC